jgi:type II secretory pathway predicted ATPase ExeA
MRKEQSWIGDRAFGSNAGEPVTVAYKSHQDALRFLSQAMLDPGGVGLLEGPAGSGKTTTAKRFAEQIPRDVAVAIVDGSRIQPRDFLSRLLSEFGYDTGLKSMDGLLKMIHMFAFQQTRSGDPPIIIIDNADRMHPGALQVLNALAELVVERRFALRIVLTGGEMIRGVVAQESMADLANRCVGGFRLEPMSLREALLYLHARLGACGINNADTVFPLDVCDRLFKLSGGWPGLMNRSAFAAINRARELPVRASDIVSQDDGRQAPASPEIGAEAASPAVAQPVRRARPKLVVTKDGRLLGEFPIKDKKVLVGRSDFADIVIEDDYASKMHALLLLFSDALVLLDLNSANGTTVNSVSLQTTILKSDDVISIGHHRIKVQNAPPIQADLAELLATPDTVKMKHLVDIRKKQIRRAELTAIQGRKGV